jgi:hypothetical protein
MKVLKVQEDRTVTLELSHREFETVLEALALNRHMAEEEERLGLAARITAVADPMSARELNELGEALCQEATAVALRGEARLHAVKKDG